MVNAGLEMQVSPEGAKRDAEELRRRAESARAEAEAAFAGSKEEMAAKRARVRSWIAAPTILIIGVAFILVGINDLDRLFAIFFLGCTAVGADVGVWALIPFAMKRARENFVTKYAVMDRHPVIVPKDDEPNMGDLLRLNRSEMDKYHELTIDQAAQSFKHSQIAMYVGFALLAVCIVIVVIPVTPTQTKLTVAALALVSTTISGYITKTFLRSHSQSVSQLNRFFNQPLVSSYLLTAERVAVQLAEDDRNKALLSVVNEALGAASTERRSEEAEWAPARRTAARKPRQGPRTAAVSVTPNPTGTTTTG
jgi:uncharacterized membrane protein